MTRRSLEFLRGFFPLLAIGGATLWACLSIALHRAAEAPPGVTVLRLAHWQLEAGVRDALEAMAADYQKLHPNVRIVQDAIPDQVFAQWSNTQLIGGTAPDLIESGGQMAPPLWLNLQRRYLLPLTDRYAEPNPYNRGTALAGVPLTQTLKAGNAVVPELQENMDISLSRLTIRIFYNRDLLKRLTGLDEPPADFGAFLAVCRQIAAQNYTPIVGSNYHFGMWNQLFDALTYPATRRGDFNRDGYVGNDELFVAFQKGLLDFSFPAYRARFELVRELSNFFQPGFTGLTREEGVLLFAQQRAVFMSTGLWEARGISDLARGKFAVGVMNFPDQMSGHPSYGKYLEGPIYEEPRGSLGFSVARTSPHPEIAADFLLFMASQREDEKLNQIIGWIPNVVGVRAAGDLAGFEPNLNGVYPAMDFALSGETMIRSKQLFDLFAIHQISYDQLAEELGAFYKDRGAVGFAEAQANWQRGLLQNEQLRTAARAVAINAPAAKADELWTKYCDITVSKQVVEAIDHAYLVQVSAGKVPAPVAADGYSPAVLEKIRQRLKP